MSSRTSNLDKALQTTSSRKEYRRRCVTSLAQGLDQCLQASSFPPTSFAQPLTFRIVGHGIEITRR